MLQTHLPPELPPASVVDGVSPAAAEKIRTVNEDDSTLSHRRAGVDIEELRHDAFGQFDGAFHENLAEQTTELLAKLTEDVERLRTHWSRLEQLRGLDRWVTYGQMRGYSPQVIPVMQVGVARPAASCRSGRGRFASPFRMSLIGSVTNAIQRKSPGS